MLILRWMEEFGNFDSHSQDWIYSLTNLDSLDSDSFRHLADPTGILEKMGIRSPADLPIRPADPIPAEKMGIPAEKMGIPAEKMGIPAEKMGIPADPMLPIVEATEIGNFDSLLDSIDRMSGSRDSSPVAETTVVLEARLAMDRIDLAEMQDNWKVK
jgi:hypothetical protein